jgi:hypothetical protein
LCAQRILLPGKRRDRTARGGWIGRRGCNVLVPPAELTREVVRTAEGGDELCPSDGRLARLRGPMRRPPEPVVSRPIFDCRSIGLHARSETIGTDVRAESNATDVSVDTRPRRIRMLVIIGTELTPNSVASIAMGVMWRATRGKGRV